MKRTFILDECTVICAHKGENERGEYDLSSAKLVVDIAHNCHCVALNRDLWRQYSAKIDDLKRDPTRVKFVNVLGILNQMSANPAKWRILSRVRSIGRKYGIPRDDMDLVRVAATVRGILVTTDNRLKDKLEGTDIHSQYGVTVVRPEEALPLAAPSDP